MCLKSIMIIYELCIMKTCGLYIVRGVEGENGAIINHVKNIDYNEKIDDTLLFDKIVMDDVHICMYECNIQMHI